MYPYETQRKSKLVVPDQGADAARLRADLVAIVRKEKGPRPAVRVETLVDHPSHCHFAIHRGF